MFMNAYGRDQFLLGRNEGHDEGVAEGLAEGLVEGRIKTISEMEQRVNSLLSQGLITEKAARELLKFELEDVQ